MPSLPQVIIYLSPSGIRCEAPGFNGSPRRVIPLPEDSIPPAIYAALLDQQALLAQQAILAQRRLEAETLARSRRVYGTMAAAWGFGFADKMMPNRAGDKAFAADRKAAQRKASQRKQPVTAAQLGF